MAVVLLLARISRTAADRVRMPGPARPDDAVALLTGVAGLATATWLALATLLTVLTVTGPASRAGRAAAPVCARMAPAGLRRVVLLAVGVTLATTAPAAAAPATTAPPPPVRPSPVTVTDRSAAALDPGWAASPGTAPTITVEPPEATVRHPRRPEDVVVVRRGDCLWNIAARQIGPDATQARIATTWPRWYSANRTTIGPDPDVLLPGQRLHPPGPSTGFPDPDSAGSSDPPRGPGEPGEQP